MVRILKILVIVCITALYACKENKAIEVPISQFFSVPEKTNFKLSPDGKYVSYLKRHNKKQNIFIESLADGTERMATSVSDFSIRDYNWTYDNQILFGEDWSRDEHPMFALDVTTLKTRKILSEGRVFVKILSSQNRQAPDIITIAMNKRDSAQFDVYRLNIKSGELKPYLMNPGNITEWFPDADGKIRLAKSSDGVDETILFRANEMMPFKAIIKNNFRSSVKPIAFTGVKNYFYALSNVGRDKIAFVEINAENGKEERVLCSSDKADIQRVDYSKNRHRPELAAWDEAKPQVKFLNADVENLYDNLSKQLGDHQINITGRDSAEHKFIVQTYTDRSRGSVYLYERKNDKLTKLADNSVINPDELCAMEPIHYKASDGIIINGYLTRPQGSGKLNLPVVVIPHEGPFGMRNTWGYNAEVQFLANRGFAVLQVNYRGSAGYGKAFYSAGFKEIGGKVQQDITDGVNWLIAQKIANPKKVAIYGRGFGGFSALYGISFYPKLYNCAVVQNGLINFFTYIKNAPQFFKPSLQKMYATIGDPEKDADNLIAISPVFHADKPKVPLLFLQDSKDQRANISELNHYIRELQKRNVQVKYSLNKNERGSAGNENKRMQNYAEIEKFLDNNMRVKP